MAPLRKPKLIGKYAGMWSKKLKVASKFTKDPGRDSQEKKLIEKIIVKLIEKFLEICYSEKMKKLE